MKLNVKRTVLVGLAFFTINAVWQLYNTEVPIMLDKMIVEVVTNMFGADFLEKFPKTTIINAIMSIDNILALILLPLFGVLSDKTHTRIGKRMPYILIGTVTAAIFLALMPIFYALGTFVGFFITLGGLLLAMSVYRSPAVALMPDVTPKPLRSKGNAIINLMGAAGNVTILGATAIIGAITAGFAKNGDNKAFYTAVFIFTAIVILTAIIAMFFTVDENKLVSMMPPDVETDEERLRREGKGKKVHATVKTSLLFLLFAVAMWYMAYGCIETNFSRYAVGSLGMNESQKAFPMLVATAAALICFVPLGILSGKLGRKKTIIIGLGVLLFAAVLATFVKILPILYVLFALIGISWAAINVNSYPMVVEMAKGADIGKYTGYYYTFQMAAQIATPLLSGMIIDLFSTKMKDSMQLLFPYASIFLVIAIVAMIFVKHGDSKDSDIQVGDKELVSELPTDEIN